MRLRGARPPPGQPIRRTPESYGLRREVHSAARESLHALLPGLPPAPAVHGAPALAFDLGGQVVGALFSPRFSSDQASRTGRMHRPQREVGTGLGITAGGHVCQVSESPSLSRTGCDGLQFAIE